MFEKMKISKYKKQLAKLKADKKAINDELYSLEEKAGCANCKMYNRGKVSSLADRYKSCSNCKGSTKCKKVASELEKIKFDIDNYIENEYAKMVFELYSAKKIKLYEKYDKKYLTWEEAFGNDFDKVSKTLRHSLVGLIEGEGRFEIK